MYLFLKKRIQSRNGKRILPILALITLVLVPFLYNLQYAHAAGLTSAFNRVRNSIPSASSVQYETGWTFPGTTAIGCMQIKYTTTASESTKPTGMTTTGATKGSVTGGGLTDGSWSLDAATDGTLKYTHATTEATTTTAIVITTNGITNPSSAGVIYAQVTTYTGSNCSTGPTDVVTVAFSIFTGQALSVTVDPSLTFAVNGVGSGQSVNGAATTVATVTSANTIPLGNVNTSTNVIAAHDLVVTTNAANGYTVYASYSGTLSDGLGHTIDDWTGTNGVPSTPFAVAGATSALGYTTASTNLSGTGDRFSGEKWAKFETWNYEVARATTKVSSDTTRIGYQVAVSGTQEAGTYQTTVILTATPTY